MAMVDTKGVNTYQKRKVVTKPKGYGTNDLDDAMKYLSDLPDVGYDELFPTFRKVANQFLAGLYNSFLTGNADIAKCATALGNIGRTIAQMCNTENTINKLNEITKKELLQMTPKELKEYTQSLIDQIN